METLTLTKNVVENLNFVSGKTTEKKVINLLRDNAAFRLKECEEKIFILEAKYGMTFEGFRNAWKQGRIANKYSHEVERNYMEWEGFQTEKKNWLTALRNLT